MIKSIFFMSISSFAKLLSGFVLFVALARVFGPSEFGSLMYNFSMASLSSIIVDYGFAAQILKDVGRSPDRVKEIMSEFLSAKLFLGVVLVILGIFITEVLEIHLVDKRLYQMLLIAAIFRSFGDFINVAFRGLGCFNKETKNVSNGLLIHFLVVFSIAIFTHNLLWVAFGFIVSRIIYCVISWHTYKRVTGDFCCPREMDTLAISKTLREGFPFASDVSILIVFQHIDTLFVNYYLGTTAVGIYKAGMNLVRGLETFSMILANVYLPIISRCSTAKNQLLPVVKNFNIQTIIGGVSLALLLSFGNTTITDILYGGKYDELISLWGYFAIFLLFRFTAVTQGLLLTAYELQYMRVRGLLIAFIIFLLSAPVLISYFGLQGVIFSQLISVALLILFYFSTLIQKDKLTGFSFTSVLAITCTTLCITLTLF